MIEKTQGFRAIGESFYACFSPRAWGGWVLLRINEKHLVMYHFEYSTIYLSPTLILYSVSDKGLLTDSQFCMTHVCLDSSHFKGQVKGCPEVKILLGDIPHSLWSWIIRTHTKVALLWQEKPAARRLVVWVTKSHSTGYTQSSKYDMVVFFN